MSFNANFAARQGLPAGEEWRTLFVIYGDPTLYYSDQGFTTGAQVYTPMVESIGKLGKGGTNIKLYNTPQIDNLLSPGQIVEVYLWMVGLDDADKELFFKGVIRDNIKGKGTAKLSFGCMTMAEYFDATVGTLLTPVSHPSADPDYYNRVIPEVFGTVENVEALPTVTGMTTTLRADISKSTTDIPITAYAQKNLTFPATPFYIWIGEERIRVNDVEEDATPRLFNCVRAQSGTTATVHSFGDPILEDIASVEYKYANHACFAVPQVAILPEGRASERDLVLLTEGVSSNDESCDSLTDYAIFGTELAEVSPAGQFHLLDDNNSAYIYISKDWGEFTDDYIFEIRIIFDQLVSTYDVGGGTGNRKQQALFVYNGIILLGVIFAADGIYVNDGTSYVLISGSSVYTDESWHTWKFVVTSSGGAESATVDIYRDETPLYASVDCSTPSAAQGIATFLCFGTSTDIAEMHIDWYKISPFSSGDYTLDLANGEMDLTDLPGIRKKVAIAVTEQPDQPITTQPKVDVTPSIHDHAGATQRITMFMDSYITNNLGIQNFMWAIVDGKFTENCEFNSNANWYLRAYLQAQPNFSGDLVRGRMKVDILNLSGGEELDMVWRLNNDELFSVEKTISITRALYVTGWQDISSYDFNDFVNANSYIELSHTDAVTPKFEAWQMWLEIEYTLPSPNKTLTSPLTIPAESLLEVECEVGGDAVTDIVPGRVFVTVQGRKDTGAGHYTGTPSALIVKPWQHVHNMLELDGNGINHSDIDHDALTDCDNNLPASYEWGFAITRQEKLSSILTRMAIQSWAEFDWSLDGLARFARKKLSGTPTVSLDTFNDCFFKGTIDSPDNELDLAWEDSSLNQIANIVHVLYDHDFILGDIVENKAYQANKNDSDSDSISRHQRQQRTWRMSAVRNDTMAVDLVDKLLTYYKIKRRAYSFATDHTNMQLVKNDLVLFSCEQLSVETKLHKVFDVAYGMINPSSDVGTKAWLTLIDLLITFVGVSDSTAVADALTQLGFGLTDSVVAEDASKIDIAAVLAESGFFADVLTNIDVAAVLTESGVFGDISNIDIDAVLADSVFFGDVLTKIARIFALAEAVFAGDAAKIDIDAALAEAVFASDALQILVREVLTTYTKVDPTSKLTVTSARSTFASLPRDGDTYLYKDFGASYFGDFEIRADFRITDEEIAGWVTILGVSNTLDDWSGWASGLAVAINGSNFYIYEKGGSSDSFTYSLDTTYYIIFERSGTSAICKIYSDAARTNLLDTLSITVATTAYRYLYITGSTDEDGTFFWCSGFVENVFIVIP